MESVFAASGDFFASLSSMAQDEHLGDRRFPCRNYLLEAGLPKARVAGYLARKGLPDPSMATANAFEALNEYHNSYIDDNVYKGVRTVPVDLGSIQCPETFRSSARLDEYGESDSGLFLVRLESISLIANIAGYGREALCDLLSSAAQDVRAGALSASVAAECNALLARWQDGVDARPLFCGFWEEARAILDKPAAGWANALPSMAWSPPLQPRCSAPPEFQLRPFATMSTWSRARHRAAHASWCGPQYSMVG